jgi:hypothetical protein
MKIMVGAALVAAQILAAGPARAAELPGDPAARTGRFGTFAGARLRLALGGGQERRLRGGLAVAPIQQSRLPSGAERTRFGEGVEFGFAGHDKLRLSLAGTPVSQLAQGGKGPGGAKVGISTIGWVGIGLGTVAVVWLGANYVIYRNTRHDD